MYLIYLNGALADPHLLIFPSIGVQIPEVILVRQFFGFLKICIFHPHRMFSHLYGSDYNKVHILYSSGIQATKLGTEKINHTAN